MGQGISLKSERKNHDLNHDLIFYCIHNQLWMPQYNLQCLEYLGYITLVLRSTTVHCTPLFFIFLAYDITGSHQELRGLGSHHIADSSYRINSSQVTGYFEVCRALES